VCHWRVASAKWVLARQFSLAARQWHTNLKTALNVALEEFTRPLAFLAQPKTRCTAVKPRFNQSAASGTRCALVVIVRMDASDSWQAPAYLTAESTQTRPIGSHERRRVCGAYTSRHGQLRAADLAKGSAWHPSQGQAEPFFFLSLRFVATRIAFLAT